VLNEQISQIAKNLKHADPGDESSRESLLEQFASSSAKQIELLIQIRDGNEQQFKLLSESLSRAFEKLDESTQKTVWERIKRKLVLTGIIIGAVSGLVTIARGMADFLTMLEFQPPGSPVLAPPRTKAQTKEQRVAVINWWPLLIGQRKPLKSRDNEIVICRDPIEADVSSQGSCRTRFDPVTVPGRPVILDTDRDVEVWSKIDTKCVSLSRNDAHGVVDAVHQQARRLYKGGYIYYPQDDSGRVQNRPSVGFYIMSPGDEVCRDEWLLFKVPPSKREIRNVLKKKLSLNF